MADKHLAEIGWKTLVVKHKIKNDAGLGKALAAYTKLGESGAHEARLGAISEVATSATKLKKDKAVGGIEDVGDWLDEVVKESNSARTAVTLLKKSAGSKDVGNDESEEGAEDDDEDAGDLLASLNRVRTGKGETVLKFAACVAKPVFGLVVAKNITPGDKKDMTEATGGKAFLVGTCLFEEGKVTFVMETVKSGLAKQLQKAIKHATTKSIAVRVRDTAGTTVFDDETDVETEDESPGADLESLKLRLATVVEGIKKAAALKKPEIASLLRDATLAASEAGVLVRKSDAKGAAPLVERAATLLRQALVATKPVPKKKEPLSPEAIAACEALAKSGEKAGYGEAGVLNAKMLEAVENCPALAKHFGDILGGTKRANILFSGTAKDAFYAKTGDRMTGVPDNVIILPTKGKTPIDLLDALIFESCNAEIQIEYDVLLKDFIGKVRTPTPQNPIPTLLVYGRQKAEIESKTVLKDAQLKFAVRESGVEISYQGQRNLLAMLKVCKEMAGGTLKDFDKTLEDPVALAKCLEENTEELGKFLKTADSDEKIKKEILTAMATSPHNRNSAKDDKNSLNTDDLYAYELLETINAQFIVTMVIEEINKVGKLSAKKEKALRPLIKSRIDVYDVMGGEAVDRSARMAVVLDILEDLKKFIPALADSEFETLGYSPAMTEMAGMRMAKFEKGNTKVFEEGVQKQQKLSDDMKLVLEGED